GAYHADEGIDHSGSEGQPETVAQAPAKRRNYDREEEEVMKKTVGRAREIDQRHIPECIQPRNDLARHDGIAADGQVINQQPVEGVENERKVDGNVKRIALLDEDDQ